MLNRFQIKAKDYTEPFCEYCAEGKMHRLPFPSSERKTTAIGEIVHADVCGPMQEPSLGGSRYFLLLKDDYSRFRTVYVLRNKSEVEQHVEDFLRKAEKVCPGGVRTLRTDNGLEFVNAGMKRLSHTFGFEHERTVAYTPEQNGAAERGNRTLVEAARTLLQDAKLERRFWAEAVDAATYTLNLSGTSSQKDATPFELWRNRPPDLRRLRTSGAEVFTHIPKERRRKLDPKAERGFLVGYAEKVKGYRVWYPHDDSVRISRDIVFSGKKHSNTPDAPVTVEELRWPEVDNEDAI